MNYKITVTKTEENPNYQAEVKERRAYPYVRQDSPYPTPTIEKGVLTVELTEDEYKKVKAEVIKIFE